VGLEVLGKGESGSVRADAERHGRGALKRGAKNLNNLVNKRAESN
jgi:hypothetical protein